MKYAGGAVWAIGFFVYACLRWPPGCIDNLDFVSWTPVWATHIGGTIPGLVFSFGAYAIGGIYLFFSRGAVAPPRGPSPPSESGVRMMSTL